MKFLAQSFFVAAILLVAVAAMPATEFDQETRDAYLDTELAVENIAPEEHGARLARATCDLLSISAFGVSVNDSACAAHCLVMGKGFKGGRCKDAVCHCRK